ncbi:ACD11 homolog protein isoform X1 [Humulus lupulus]|uniref:ACD11 homolog protein isoform X1 n=1 Tax=Humulus lupulus TaxID=3486 RepID=UPI002B40E511|nr:ACD11 homolog protein isoform X1 [Humulus lupulus]
MILNARESCAAMDGGVPERFINASTAASSYPLSAIADAFEELSKLINSGKLNESQPYQLRLDTFCEACSLISFLFGCLGLAFKFAECEYVSKVHNLVEASKRYGSLQNMIDSDVANGTVKTSGSNSRNLRRVRQGLDLIRALFDQFLSNDDYYLKGAASTAYAEVCAPYHSWAIRAAVAAGMYALPTREQLLLKLNETNQSAEKKMRRYITASIPVIEYIDKLYLSRNIKLDW